MRRMWANIAGKLPYKKEISGLKMRIQLDMPEIKILDNGRRVVVKLGHRVQIYKNEFAE